MKIRLFQILSTVFFLGVPAQAQDQIDYAALPEVDLLRRYIRIDTSTDGGSELAGAEFLAAELRALGLEPTIERLGDTNRAEQLDHLRREHGPVVGLRFLVAVCLAHGQPPGALAPKWKRAE